MSSTSNQTESTQVFPSESQVAKSRATPGPQRKACEQCFSVKVRCDHRRPTCLRCQKRGHNCTYATLGQADEQLQITYQDVFNAGSGPSGIVQSAEAPLQLHSDEKQPLDFSNINMICPVDHERVQNRWLEGFAPSRQPKDLSPGMTFFMLTVLRSYPRMLTKSNNLPPFVHEKQISHGQLPSHLARCATIAHMWASQVVGGEEMVREMISNEMVKIIEQESHLDDISRLEAFQAYILYSLMLLPETSTGPVMIDQSSMLRLQEFAATMAKTGLMCPAEQTDDRPDWGSWILAETKRRTLYTIYMFDDVVNTINGLPCILGDELGLLPMSCGKGLWNAVSRNFWEQEYRSTLGKGKPLRLFELWIHPADAEVRKRREVWLSDSDEYGMTIYAVASIAQLG